MRRALSRLVSYYRTCPEAWGQDGLAVALLQQGGTPEDVAELRRALGLGKGRLAAWQARTGFGTALATLGNLARGEAS